MDVALDHVNRALVSEFQDFRAAARDVVSLPSGGGRRLGLIVRRQHAFRYLPGPALYEAQPAL